MTVKLASLLMCALRGAYSRSREQFVIQGMGQGRAKFFTTRRLSEAQGHSGSLIVAQ